MTGPPLVHGLGHDLVAPDWPPITPEEAHAVLTEFGCADVDSAAIVWHSPRPLSAAAILRLHSDATGERRVVIKRHDRRVRAAAALAREHRFAEHLNAAGVATVRPLRTPAGATVVELAGRLYELQELADGVDLYRDAISWTGYRATGHAHAAGAALARLHQGAASFRAPARALGPLGDSLTFAEAADPVLAVSAHVAGRPGLTAALAPWPWTAELGEVLGDPAPARRLAALPRIWGHGDWHPSNLTWTGVDGDAAVATVLDLGLANRTTPAWDIAIALERACVDWLAADEGAAVTTDLAATDALLAGYETVRPLAEAEADALAVLLPVVHVAFALSEVEYYGSVLNSPERAEIAYRGYLLDHCRWFRSADATPLLDHLRRRRWRAVS